MVLTETRPVVNDELTVRQERGLRTESVLKPSRPLADDAFQLRCRLR